MLELSFLFIQFRNVTERRGTTLRIRRWMNITDRCNRTRTSFQADPTMTESRDADKTQYSYSGRSNKSMHFMFSFSLLENEKFQFNIM